MSAPEIRTARAGDLRELTGIYNQVGHELGRYWDVAWFEKGLA